MYIRIKLSLTSLRKNHGNASKEVGKQCRSANTRLMLTECCLEIGAMVEMIVENKTILVTRKEQDSYRLEDLLKGSTPSQFELGAEDHSWVYAKSAGNEIL